MNLKNAKAAVRELAAGPDDPATWRGRVAWLEDALELCQAAQEDGSRVPEFRGRMLADPYYLIPRELRDQIRSRLPEECA